MITFRTSLTGTFLVSTDCFLPTGGPVRTFTPPNGSYGASIPELSP